MKLMEETQDLKLISLARLVKSYVLTEKATKLYEDGQRQYSFIVDPQLKKPELKSLLELLFSVKIKSIRTSNLYSKKVQNKRSVGRKTRNKKVYITLHENYKIDNLYN